MRQLKCLMCEHYFDSEGDNGELAKELLSAHIVSEHGIARYVVEIQKMLMDGAEIANQVLKRNEVIKIEWLLNQQNLIDTDSDWT